MVIDHPNRVMGFSLHKSKNHPLYSILIAEPDGKRYVHKALQYLLEDIL